MRIAMIACVLLFSSAPAQACIISKELSQVQKSEADVIFYGWPIGYTPTSGRGDQWEPARMTYEIESVLRGDLGTEDKITVYWVNGTFVESLNLNDFKFRYGTKQRVGLILPETYRSWCRIKDYKNALTGKITQKESCLGPFNARPVPGQPDLPWVMNAGCSNSFIYSED